MGLRLKLALINPAEKKSYGFSAHRFLLSPPLSLAYLAALTPDDWDVEIVDENFDAFKIIEDADLVGITSFTSTVRRAYEIAQLYDKRGIPTVMGGIHVAMLPDEALQHCRSVVMGEAEEVWRHVLDDFRANNLKEKYRGPWASLENMVKPRRDVLSKRYVRGTIQTSPVALRDVTR